MLKRVLKIVVIFLIGTVGGIFADQIFWPYFIERPLFFKYRLDQPPVYITETKEIIVQENTALTRAIEKTERTIIGIRTKTKSGTVLEGSGVIVSSDGLAVTLASLVPQGAETNLFWENSASSFQILKRDFKENLALIKIEKKNLPTVSFADFEKTKLGQRVFLAGLLPPAKSNEPFRKVVNEGIIRRFDEDFIRTNIFEKFIVQGSPLFDIEGNLLGINTLDSEARVISVPVSKIKSFTGF